MILFYLFAVLVQLYAACDIQCWLSSLVLIVPDQTIDIVFLCAPIDSHSLLERGTVQHHEYGVQEHYTRQDWLKYVSGIDRVFVFPY
jgi:hypothetical protein